MKMKELARPFAVLVLLACACAATTGGEGDLAAREAAAANRNWPQWRGPFLNGSTAETGLPTTFSRTENVVWRVPMPGPSAATPAVWGDRVFVSSTVHAANEPTKGLVALCYDLESGRLLWSRKAGRERRAPRDNNMASPSPIATADAVYFYYGTGGLFAFDHEGEPLWERNLERDHGHNALIFGYSSSPVLWKDTLYVIAVRNDRQDRSGRSDSYLLAVDRTTGKDLWKHVRRTDARGESQESYATAVPFEHDGRTDILVFGADYLTGHDPETGEERWRWATYNPRKISHWRVIPSPVVVRGAAGDLVFIAGPKHSRGFAIRPKAAHAAGWQGRLGDDHVAWTFDRRIPDASTPLYYKGRLYVLDDDRKVLTCLDPATGKELWQGRLETKAVIRASITGADDKLYIISEAHEALVLDADEFNILHRTEMGGKGVTRSTIVAAQGRLFIRTAEALYQVRSGPSKPAAR